MKSPGTPNVGLAVPAARQAFGMDPTPWSQILDGVIAFYRQQ